MKAAARYVFPVIGKLVPAAKLGVSETVSSLALTTRTQRSTLLFGVELRKVEIPAVLRSRSLYFEDLAETEGLEW